MQRQEPNLGNHPQYQMNEFGTGVWEYRLSLEDSTLVSPQPPVCDYPCFITSTFRLVAEEEEDEKDSESVPSSC